MPKGQMGSNKSVKEVSDASERQVAKELGGRRVTGSGCVDSLKGDVKTDDFLLEMKSTSSKSFILPKDIVSKICREAREAGKKPGLIFKFEKTPLGVPNTWVLLPLNEFKSLIERD